MRPRCWQRSRKLAAIVLAAGLTASAALAAAPPLTPQGGSSLPAQLFQILTTHLPLPHAGHRYAAKLASAGGTPPIEWKLVRGPLPRGLHLDPDTGQIGGVAWSNKPFTILVEARDSATPPRVITRLLPAAADAPLSLRWTTPPARAGGEITGALRVSTGLPEPVTLTVIVVAVNEIGKAFALRYARLRLQPGASTPPLDFVVTLPRGAYTLHADAVATIPSTGAIYRQRLERSCALPDAPCR